MDNYIASKTLNYTTITLYIQGNLGGKRNTLENDRIGNFKYKGPWFLGYSYRFYKLSISPCYIEPLIRHFFRFLLPLTFLLIGFLLILY